MKKLLFALTITALFISTTAFAQLTWEDNIGVYFNETATSNCQAAPGVAVYNGFVVLTHLTSPAISGWEAKITGSGGGALTAVTPRGLAINAANRADEYIIGLGAPLLATNGTLVIADVSFVISDDTVPFNIFVGHIYFDTLGNNLPAYVDGADANLVKRLAPAIGGTGDPQLIANGTCGVVENEDASFGAVKALFR